MGPNPTLTKTITAGGAITRRRIVKFGSSDATMVQASAATDALIGVATGTLALLLCCAMLAAFPASTEGAGAAGPRAAALSTAMARERVVAGPATSKERYA